MTKTTHEQLQQDWATFWTAQLEPTSDHIAAAYQASSRILMSAFNISLCANHLVWLQALLCGIEIAKLDRKAAEMLKG